MRVRPGRKAALALLAFIALYAGSTPAKATEKRGGAQGTSTHPRIGRQPVRSSSWTPIDKIDRRASSTSITIRSETMARFPRGSWWWVDSWGRRHYIIPHSQRDRLLLQAGFVPYRMMPYCTRDGLVRYAGVETSRPGTSVYPITRQPAPPEKKEAQEPPVVLRPREPGEAAKYLYPSKLSRMLGGRAEAGQSFVLGENYMGRGMLKEAVSSFRRAKLNGPDDPVTALALGVALLAYGEFQDAIPEIRRGLSHHHDPSTLALDTLIAFGGTDFYSRQVRVIRARLHADPQNADLNLLMGFHYFVSAQWEEAIRHLEAAEAADPADAATARLRALAMGRMHEEADQATGPDEAAPAAAQEDAPPGSVTPAGAPAL